MLGPTAYLHENMKMEQQNDSTEPSVSQISEIVAIK